jgi:hypothetical protein
MARAEELTKIAHRGALAAVDWVESLVEIGEFIDTEDKVALVKGRIFGARNFVNIGKVFLRECELIIRLLK